MKLGNESIGIGIVGAGMVGQLAHLANFVQIPGCRVVALAELRPELGRRAAAAFGVPRVYGSHRELLADPEIEGVVVVTRRPATGPIVLDALQARKHVLSEKPMAHTVEQAERLVAAAAAHPLCYAIGFMKRHDSGAQLMKTQLDALRDSRELGRILLVRAYCFGGAFAPRAEGYVMTDESRPEGLELWPSAPAWIPAERSADYAWFLNVFVHDLNILRFLMGATPNITSVDLSRPNGRFVTMDFGAFPAVLEMAEVASGDWLEGVEVLFERGHLSLSFASPLRHESARVTLLRGDAVEAMVLPVAPTWSFRRQAEAFVADIASGAEPLASGRDSLDDLRLAEAIWRLEVTQR